MIKLGLIPEGVLLRAKRAIYGLRASPAQWEKLRDSMLCGATLEPADGDKYPTLILEAMKGIGGVFLVRVEATGELVGIMLCLCG